MGVACRSVVLCVAKLLDICTRDLIYLTSVFSAAFPNVPFE